MDKPASYFTTHLRLFAHFRLVTSLWLVAATAAVSLAQNLPVESGGGEFLPEIPASYSGSGSFFNRQLGTAFRFGYHTKGYGTQEGIVTLGTMKVFNQEGSTLFLDVQATLSEEFGGGYNAGIGFRQLSDLGFGPDSKRINGLSFWADGQSTSADNFFNQLGVAAESLGDSFDVRFQGNFPLERTKDDDLMDVADSDPFFAGDALMGSLQQFYRDTALTVLDLEGAARISNLEAWGYLAGYHLTGSGMDATGYRAGVRGYAVPDVALSLQVTDDDIYQTNVMFGITWFVGRTNSLNQPCGTLLDRFREPVLRNDYIATTQELIDKPIDPLRDAITDEQLVFVHVNSNAADGGDGTVENPFNDPNHAVASSDEDDLIIAQSGSDFTVGFDPQDRQRVLGQGLDPNGILIEHFVNTNEGLFALPETSPGSNLLDAPIINAGAGTVFDLGNSIGVEVNNFVINGGTTAVSANQADSPKLANLDINSPTGDAIIFTGVTGNSLIENSVIINGAGGKGILIDGGSGVLGANAMINDPNGLAIEITGRTGGSVTVGEIHQTGGGEGISVHDNSGGTISFSSLAEVTTSGADSAVVLEDNAGTTITFQELQATSDTADTFVVNGGGSISVTSFNPSDPNSPAFISNTGSGTALAVRGNVNFDGDPTVFILADVMNSGTDQAVDIQDMEGGSVSVTGDITDDSTTGSGILVENNTAGTFSFTGVNTLDTGAVSAVTLRNNDGATVNFDNLNATAAAGDTFVVEGGGKITVNNDPNNPGLIANTAGGTAVSVRGDDFVTATGDPNMSIAVDIINTGGGMSVDIQDITGSGILFSGLIDDTDGGVLIKDNTGGTILFTDVVTVDTGNNDAVELVDNTGATISFNGFDITSSAGFKGFTATGGGELTVTNGNDNTILQNDTGTALELDSMTISPAGVAFDTVDVPGGTDDAILLKDLDGSGLVTVGSGSDPNSGGTITTSGTAISVDNVNRLAVNNITVDNSTGNGVNVTGQASGSTATFTDLTVSTTTGDGVTVENNPDGDITFNGLDVTATGTGNAVTNTDNTGATISYRELTAMAADGHTFAVQGGGSVNVQGTGAGSTISNTGTGNALFVQGDEADTDPPMDDFDGDPTLTVSADIDNTFDGRVASIRRMTGGSVTVNGAVTDDASGILIEDNTGGTINFNDSVTLNTAANDALTIQSNGSGNTVNFNNASQLDIDTTSGTGIVLNGPGTVNINGSGNTVDTTTGVGIATTNVGNATINRTTINTTGSHAVDVSHDNADATSLTLNTVTVASAGSAGVNVLANGFGEFDLVMDNVDISGIGQEGILFDTGASADRVDLTIKNSLITAGDDEAFYAMLGDSDTADVRFLIEDNQFSNNSGAADTDSAAFNILVSSGMTLNATVGDGSAPDAPIGDNNRFVNSSADGDAFLATINDGGAGGTLNLDLRDNTAQSSGTGLDFGITNTSGTFGLVDKTATLNGDNNVGTVTDSGTIDDLVSPPLLMPTP